LASPLSPTSATSRLKETFSARQLRVLFVDDEPLTRDVFGVYLKTVGVDVTLARDGTEALRLARQSRPHVIVLDLRMPGDYDGYEVIRALRGSPDTASIPVLLFTGAIGADHGSAAARGADAVVTKPCAPSVLLAAIRRFGGRA
jgi:CheY-like chemotaxis protein